MTIVVYSSHTGSTKKYAEIFSERTGLSCYSIKDKYDPEERIIFFGWLRGPRIVGLDAVDRSKIIAIGIVSLDDNPDFGWNKVVDTNKIKVPHYHMRGWVDRKKLNIFDKTLFTFLCAMYKLKGFNPHTQQLFDAMMNGGSFFDESALDNLILFASTNQ